MSLHCRQTNIPLGSMTSEEFSQWITGASESIQDSIITDLSWWAQRDTVLHHQFLLLRFKHLELGGSMQFQVYEVRLERAGKVIPSLAGQAIDTATISIPPPKVDPEFFKSYRLLFALLTHPEIVLPPRHNSGQTPRSTGGAGPPTAYREELLYYDAFVDFLDHKWRGPPARLRDLGRYLPVIVRQNSHYSLASTNCFWYARLVTHTIALRHYSFPHLATSIQPSKYVIPRTYVHTTSGIGTADWRRHDPSSISLLFRYLHYQEWRNGILMYRRLIIIIFSVLLTATLTGVPYVVYRSGTQAKWKSVIAAIGIALYLFLFLTGAVMLVVRQLVAGLTSLTIRRGTDGVMRALDREFTAPPQAARGDYVPLPIPLVQVQDEVTDMRPASRNEVRTYHMEVAHGPRSLPTLWENEHQIFAEKRQDYEESWRLLSL
ncbi:hypothetical protein FB451DRAFT_1570119 [Mycena latifolia]|nr:hypothetical protein FB451DRAFT_1570119 [Mycena latifolia]